MRPCVALVARAERASGRPPVVDLEPDQWCRVPEERIGRKPPDRAGLTHPRPCGLGCVSHTADRGPSGPGPEGHAMTTTNGGTTQATDGGPQDNAAQPQLKVLAQYVKDLSFENPDAPRSLQQQQQAPQIKIQINVNAKPLSGTEHEVELKIEGRAEAAGSLLFAFDLLYAGVFRISNVPQDSLQAVIMIECPRLLFPFARELIATAVRNGGFPPLMIDPVDFVSLYRQKLAETQPQSAPPPG